MSKGQTIILARKSNREFAKGLIDDMPPYSVVNVRLPKRTIDQNDKMWAMLSDVSRAKPQDRFESPENWKFIFMDALGHEVKFLTGLEGNPFPIGHKSSQLTVAEMGDLIELIYMYGAKWGVEWTEPEAKERAAA